MNRRIFTLVTIGLILYWGATAVRACAPAQGTRFATIEQTTEDAPYVVEAMAREYVGNGVYRVQIFEWLKGAGSEEALISGFAPLEGVISSCDTKLPTGSRVLLFLASESTGRYTIRFASNPDSPARGLWVERMQFATDANTDAVRNTVAGQRR